VASLLTAMATGRYTQGRWATQAMASDMVACSWGTFVDGYLLRLVRIAQPEARDANVIPS
jgi:hypothetical protein